MKPEMAHEKYVRIVSAICAAIVGHENAEIYPDIRENGIMIHVKVEQADMGKLIGRNGKMATVIRDLIKQVGYMNDMLVTVSIHNNFEEL